MLCCPIQLSQRGYFKQHMLLFCPILLDWLGWSRQSCCLTVCYSSTGWSRNHCVFAFHTLEGWSLSFSKQGPPHSTQWNPPHGLVLSPLILWRHLHKSRIFRHKAFIFVVNFTLWPVARIACLAPLLASDSFSAFLCAANPLFKRVTETT